jgi:hypothetical protein
MGKLFYFFYVKSRPSVAGKCPTAAIWLNNWPSAGTPAGVLARPSVAGSVAGVGGLAGSPGEKRKLAEAVFLSYLRQLEKLRQMQQDKVAFAAILPISALAGDPPPAD